VKIAMLLVSALSVSTLLGVGLTSTAQAADADAGKKVFSKCAVCHTAVAGKNGLGPSLFGVVGRQSGSVPGYSYSEAMKSAGKTWDEATLDAYLADPKAAVPGNKMSFAGLPNAEDRANVIAYLATLK
jgi:cytochrome c